MLLALFDLNNWSKASLRDRRPADHVGHGEDVLLDLGGQAEHAHDLGNPGAGDPLSPGYSGLICGLAALQEPLPLDGLTQEFDDLGGVLESLGGFGLPRRGATALTTRSAGTRRVRMPMLVFSKAPLGPRAISTVCFR